jgi:hypothetical protein
MQSRAWRLIIIIGSGCLLVLFLALLLPRAHRLPVIADAPSPASNAAPGESAAALARSTRAFRRTAASTDVAAPTAEEIVAHKLVRFGRNRRELVHALAKRFNVTVPDDVERFFDAVEGGRWEEIEAAFNAIRGSHPSVPRSDDLFAIWRPIQEAWGAARETHHWPAQKLLDYGDAVLGSLRPGMIYAGGTDPGAFITTMLNETAEGERHIILTQNALASTAYLDHLNFLYGDRLATLTSEDNKRIYEEYASDARKRFEHDQQFPDEPKQLRPDEDISIVDGKVKVAGYVAVMALNEKLFQLLMQKNPEASFAMEESYPFKSTFGTATALGALMELRVQDEQNVLTRERAAQSVDYWRTTAQQLLADTEAADSRYVRMAYSKLASSQAGLLLERGYTAEAEQAFRYAYHIAPTSPEAVYRYINLLVGQNRVHDALPLAENAVRMEPENKQFRNLVQELQKKNRH